jgi:hypothetical protein
MSPFIGYTNIEKGLKGRPSSKNARTKLTEELSGDWRGKFFSADEAEKHDAFLGLDKNLAGAQTKRRDVRKAMESFFQLLSNPASG